MSCSSSFIDPEVFDSFTTWLSDRQTKDTTPYVTLFHDFVSGVVVITLNASLVYRLTNYN